MSTRLALPNLNPLPARCNHVTQKVIIADQRILCISVHKIGDPLKEREATDISIAALPVTTSVGMPDNMLGNNLTLKLTLKGATLVKQIRALRQGGEYKAEHNIEPNVETNVSVPATTPLSDPTQGDYNRFFIGLGEKVPTKIFSKCWRILQKCRDQQIHLGRNR